MRLLVDGDSCGHRHLILDLAKEYAIELHWANNVSQNPPAEEEGLKLKVYLADAAREAADMILMNLAATGDVVVTGDLGLASVVIARGAAALSPRGHWYYHAELAQKLEFRHLRQEVKRRGGAMKSSAAKKRFLDEERFEAELRHAFEGKAHGADPG